MNIIDIILQKNIEIIEQYEELLKEAKENPAIILTSLYTEGEDSILSYIIKTANKVIPDSIDEFVFQCCMYELLIPFLKKKFSDYSIIYKCEVYPASIYILDRNETSDILGILNIYDHTISVVEDIKIVKKRKEIELLQDEIEEKNKELENRGVSMDHILLDAKNPLQMADMFIRKNKYQKEARNKFKKASEELFNLECKLNRLQESYNKLIDDKKECKYKQNKVIEYFKKNYNYSVKYE